MNADRADVKQVNRIADTFGRGVATYVTSCGRYHFTITPQVAVMIDLNTGVVSFDSLGNFQLIVGRLLANRATPSPSASPAPPSSPG